MKRRNFIRVALGVAAQAAVVPTCLLAVEDAEEKYYSAFRERCRRLAEQDYEIKACWLGPPQDGFRHVTVFHSRGKIEFYQPWGESK